MKIKILLVFGLIALVGIFFLQSKPKNLNVVIISIDTLRADHLGCYGYTTARTPNIDSIASEGVVFERAFAQSPLTLPSHSSMMSGTNPTTHGVKDNLGYPFDNENIPTIASILKSYKYQTMGVVSAAPLNASNGLREGFDVYYDVSHLKMDNNERFIAERTADESVDIACQAITEMAGNANPFFLWLHVFDPHANYNPPQQFAEMFMHPYDGEIAYVDHCLGRLFKQLKDTGKYDDTVIVIVSDHGESLGEHEEMSHGYFIYNSTLHIPLIIKSPDISKGKRIGFPVRSIDIMPTTLSLLNVKNLSSQKDSTIISAKCEGLDLSQYLKSTKREKLVLPCYAETYYPYHVFGWRVSKSLLLEDYKYINTKKGELYNIIIDPKETTNLLHNSDPDIASKYQKIAQSFQEKILIWEQSAKKEKYNPVDMNESAMASLPYLKGNKPKAEPNLGADTKEMMHIVNKITQAQTQMIIANYDMCEKTLHSVIEEDQGNIMAWMLLGKLYSKMSLHEKAFHAFSEMEKLCTVSSFARNGRIDSLLQANNLLEAEKLIDETLQQKMYEDAFLYSRKAYICLENKLYSEAEIHAKKATVLDSKLPSAPFYLAKALHGQKKYMDAIAAYQASIKLQNIYPEAYYHLGVCLFDIEKYKEGEEYLKKAIEYAPSELKSVIHQFLSEKRGKQK